MNACKKDILVNTNTKGFREFKFDTKIEFTIYADCIDTIYEILSKIACLKITTNSSTFQRIDEDAVMLRLIIDNEIVQSEPNLYAVKMILKDCNVKFTMKKVLRVWFVYEGVGGYVLLLKALNDATTVNYSYGLSDGSIILGIKSLEKAIRALNEMICK